MELILGNREFIKVSHIARPISEVFSCAPQADSLEVSLTLRSRQFDSCPVIEGGVPVGVLVLSDCKSGVEAGEAMQAIGMRSIISADTGFIETANRLLEDPFQFILEGSRLTGFVTAVDLGSPIGKSFIYLRVASVEMNFCKYLRSCFVDSADALLLLSQTRQEILSEFIARQKIDDEFIDCFAACNLADLLQIAGKQEGFKESLRSFGSWTGLKRGLVALRNDVMHPDRSLYTSGRDLGDLISRIHNLESIQNALEQSFENSSISIDVE